MIQQRKKVKNFNQMLQAYEDSCNKIMDRYTSQMSQLTNQSIQTLYTLFQTYLSHKKVNLDTCQNTQAQSTQQSSNKKPTISGAKIYEQDFFYCPVSVKKTKSNEDKENEQIVLSKKMGKLTLGYQEVKFQQEEDEQQDSYLKQKNHHEDFANKNIAQIIQASKKKARENKQKMNNQQIQIQDSDCQYILTDYSSNQSSNEASYEPHYIQQTHDKPLFGGLFSKSQSSLSQNSNNSNTNLLNFNFSSKQLLKSPKKQRKNKRLFIGQKKIPKWAEDLAQIQQNCIMQDQTKNSPFKLCVVQNLDTGVIFRSKQEISRTSSAKWNSQIFKT